MLLGVPAADGAPRHRSQWSAPQVLGEGSTERALAGNRRGDAVIAWRIADGDVRVALAKPGKRFGASRLIGENAGYGPLAAMNSRGDVAAAWGYNNKIPPYRNGWRCCQRLRVAMLSASGRVVGDYTIAPPETTMILQSIAVANDGLVVVAFEAAPQSSFAVGGDLFGTTRLMLQAGRLGGPLQRSVDLGAMTQLILLMPQRNETSALYDAKNMTGITEIFLGVGRPTRTTDFGDIDFLRSPSSLGQDAYGDQVVASVRSESGVNHLAIAFRRHGGKFGFRTVMSQPGEPPKVLVGLEPPTLAVAPSGRTLVMWDGGSGFTGPKRRSGIWAVSGDARNDRMGSPTFLGIPEHEGVGRVAGAIDSNGQAVVLVESLVPTRQGSRSRLTGFLSLPGGRFDKGLTLGSTGSSWGGATAVIDDRGRGIVVCGADGDELISRRFDTS